MGTSRTCSTTFLEMEEVHFPSEKVPQLPYGSPKLANSIAMIFLWFEHFKLAIGFAAFATGLMWLFFLAHDFTLGGWFSEMKLQIVSLSTVRISIDWGLPPSSSNTTKRLSLGLMKDLGIWYLVTSKFRKLIYLFACELAKEAVHQ